MRRFKKELVSRPLYTSKGHPIQFQNIGDDIGLLETNDPHLISELEALIKRGGKGVVEILSDEEWEAQKKMASARDSFRQRSKPRFDSPRIDSPQVVRPASAAPAIADPSIPPASNEEPVGKALEIPSEDAIKKPKGRRPKATTATSPVAEEPVTA